MNPDLRNFVFYLGNPLVKVAEYKAYSEEEAWDSARDEYGNNAFFADSQIRETVEDAD